MPGAHLSLYGHKFWQINPSQTLMKLEYMKILPVCSAAVTKVAQVFLIV